MQVKKRKVNDFVIVLPDVHRENRPPFIPGVFPKPTPKIIQIGKRGSGKTTVNYNIIMRWINQGSAQEQEWKQKQQQRGQGIADAHTEQIHEARKRIHEDNNEETDDNGKQKGPKKKIVIIFAKTLKDDPLYIDLTKPFKFKVNKEDKEPDTLTMGAEKKVVKGMLSTLKEMGSNKGTDIEEVPNPWVHGFDDVNRLPQVIKLIKKTYKDVDYLLCLDDLPRLLKDPFIEEQVRLFRHYAPWISSCHYLHDLPRGTRQNIDYLIIFPNMDEEKVELTRKELGIDLSEDEFLRIYKDATLKGPGNFLFIDIDNKVFRHNFDKEYEFPDLKK